MAVGDNIFKCAGKKYTIIRQFKFDLQLLQFWLGGLIIQLRRRKTDCQLI